MQIRSLIFPGLLALQFLAASQVFAFDSGSSGADGVLAPTVNTEIPLPPSGVLNYTSVNIPTGVTVTFRKNATNTPVVMLVSGNVSIVGTINISGASSRNVGASGDGVLGDDGLPGVGGPGGGNGGRGGQPGAVRATTMGGAGIGPGGGAGGWISAVCSNYRLGGAGAGYAVTAANASNGCGSTIDSVIGGPAYGSAELLPLLGGSGGGGGGGGPTFSGSGGGGGGGAILIAASGSISIVGSILAVGGASGSSAGQGCGTIGGGGSGGAIRLVATSISGNGSLSALGGGTGDFSSCSDYYGGYGSTGSAGRIRLESENITRTAASNPTHTFRSIPGPLFISGLPSLKITSVAGVAVSDQPTGVADVSLPTSTPNPVTVAFRATAVPLGNTVKLVVTPANGARVTVVSTALDGDIAASTASATVTLPTGPSTLLATVTYTIVASAGDALSTYAQGERVTAIELAAAPGQPSSAWLLTASGKRHPAPADAFRIAALGN